MTTTNVPTVGPARPEHAKRGLADVPVVIFDPSETDSRECNPAGQPAPINTGKYLGYEL